MSGFERPTIQEIYARIKADMEARVSSGVKIPRFSLLGILAIVFAGAMHLLYGYLVWLADQLFIDTAGTWFLDRIANLYNLPRKPATYTTGVNGLTGVTGELIPAGTVIVNSEGFDYTTDEDVTLVDSAGEVSVTANVLNPGTVSNSNDTVMQLQTPLPGVDTFVTVVSGFDNGVEQETNDELRSRLRQRIQNPPSSGTCADYVRWLLSVSGVGRAWCYDAESDDPAAVGSITVGAGSVVLVIAASDLSVVAPSIKQAAEDYVKTVKPATATIALYDADPKPTVLTIAITPNTADNRNAADKNLSDMFISTTAPSGVVLLSAMNSAVAASAVTDYSINGIDYDSGALPVANISTPGLEVAQFTGGIYSDI